MIVTTKEDRIEVFGVLEFVLPMGNDIPEQPEAILLVKNQKLVGHALGDGTMQFHFCPKVAKSYGFKVRSNVPELDGKAGGITAYTPSPIIAQRPAANSPNWWMDDPTLYVVEGSHNGVKTVSRWREDFLCDFAQRMLCYQSPASTQSEK